MHVCALVLVNYQADCSVSFDYSFPSHAGPASPNPPVSLGALNVLYDAATIVWAVTQIAYTSESYVVRYGTEMNNLTNSSNPVEGETDFSWL